MGSDPIFGPVGTRYVLMKIFLDTEQFSCYEPSQLFDNKFFHKSDKRRLFVIICFFGGAISPKLTWRRLLPLFVQHLVVQDFLNYKMYSYPTTNSRREWKHNPVPESPNADNLCYPTTRIPVGSERPLRAGGMANDVACPHGAC